MSATAPADDASAHRLLVERLVPIWKRTLRIASIAPDSNFFDLGGDSLLAVSLFLEIERETGIDLPITAIYDAPTIAELAELMASEAVPGSAPLVLLKQGEAEAPFFIVHGIGGTVMELAALGRKIAIPDAVYALQARGLDGAEAPLDSVEGMAELYLDWVRQTQPAGPYWLCGYSFGGLVALEMARRLRSVHEDIALLILMDAYAHPATWPALSRAKMQTRRALHRLDQTRHRPLRETVPFLLRHAKATLAPPPRQLRQWLLDRNPDLPLPLLNVREAGDWALASYVPRFYPGKITFLEAARRDAEFPDDPRRIWGPLVQEMEIHTVPGGHRTLVTEHPAAIAQQLTACIMEARRRRASRSIAPAHVVRVCDFANERRLEIQAV